MQGPREDPLGRNFGCNLIPLDHGLEEYAEISLLKPEITARNAFPGRSTRDHVRSFSFPAEARMTARLIGHLLALNWALFAENCRQETTIDPLATRSNLAVMGNRLLTF